MTALEYTTITDVELGVESKSGKALSVKIDGEWKWIPLSVVGRTKRDDRFHESDEIDVATWYVEENELV